MNSPLGKIHLACLIGKDMKPSWKDCLSARMSVKVTFDQSWAAVATHSDTIHSCTNTQKYRSTNTQKHKYTNTNTQSAGMLAKVTSDQSWAAAHFFLSPLNISTSQYLAWCQSQRLNNMIVDESPYLKPLIAMLFVFWGCLSSNIAVLNQHCW